MKSLSSICSYYTINNDIVYQCNEPSNNNNYLCKKHYDKNTNINTDIYYKYLVTKIKKMLCECEVAKGPYNRVIVVVNILRFIEDNYKILLKYKHFRNTFFNKIDEFVVDEYDRLINNGFDIIEYKKRISCLIDIKI